MIESTLSLNIRLQDLDNLAITTVLIVNSTKNASTTSKHESSVYAGK